MQNNAGQPGVLQAAAEHAGKPSAPILPPGALSLLPAATASAMSSHATDPMKSDQSDLLVAVSHSA